MPTRAPGTRLFLLAVCGLTALLSCQAAAGQKTGGEKAIRYWTQSREQPRPLRIHHLKVDLRDPGHEVIAMIADDPDGDGPADSRLEDPVELANRHRALAAVNTNAFGALPNSKGERDNIWFSGKPVEILSWAVSDGRQSSAPQSACMSFWIDREGRPHIGALDAPGKAREAVAGFGPLIIDGKKKAREGGPLHPRTALGFDRTGRWLFLVVVDGRRPGYSEGMSEGELASLMQELGCNNAINLDGGGSSIMLLRDGKGELQAANRPSDNRRRPIPVMIGVRERKRP